MAEFEIGNRVEYAPGHEHDDITGGRIERFEPGDTGVAWVRWDGYENLRPVAVDWLTRIRTRAEIRAWDPLDPRGHLSECAWLNWRGKPTPGILCTCDDYSE